MQVTTKLQNAGHLLQNLKRVYLCIHKNTPKLAFFPPKLNDLILKLSRNLHKIERCLLIL